MSSVKLGRRLSSPAQVAQPAQPAQVGSTSSSLYRTRPRKSSSSRIFIEVRGFPNGNSIPRREGIGAGCLDKIILSVVCCPPPLKDTRQDNFSKYVGAHKNFPSPMPGHCVMKEKQIEQNPSQALSSPSADPLNPFTWAGHSIAPPPARRKTIHFYWLLGQVAWRCCSLGVEGRVVRGMGSLAELWVGGAGCTSKGFLRHRAQG